MKRILKRALIAIVVLTVLLVGAAWAFVAWMGRPTTGPRIGRYDTPRTAVLVVDIQEDYTGPNARSPFRDGDRIVNATNQLIAEAQERGALVVFVENHFVNPVLSALVGWLNAPGAPGTAMDRRLTRPPGAQTFAKTRGDAFVNPALDEYLRRSQVERLVVVGLDGAHCVTATTRGALNRGYQVVLVEEGIATQGSKSVAELAKGWRALAAKATARMEW